MSLIIIVNQVFSRMAWGNAIFWVVVQTYEQTSFHGSRLYHLVPVCSYYPKDYWSLEKWKQAVLLEYNFSITLIVPLYCSSVVLAPVCQCSCCRLKLQYWNPGILSCGPQDINKEICSNCSGTEPGSRERAREIRPDQAREILLGRGWARSDWRWDW